MHQIHQIPRVLVRVLRMAPVPVLQMVRGLVLQKGLVLVPRRYYHQRLARELVNQRCFQIHQGQGQGRQMQEQVPEHQTNLQKGQERGFQSHQNQMVQVLEHQNRHRQTKEPERRRGQGQEYQMQALYLLGQIHPGAIRTAC